MRNTLKIQKCARHLVDAHLRLGLTALLLSLGSGPTSAQDASAAVLRLAPQSLASPVPAFDLTMLPARPVAKRLVEQPVVQWHPLPGETFVCPQAVGTQDLYLAEQGCVLVEPSQSRCQVYTASRTTHSIIGHLMRHCFEGRAS